VGEIGHGTKLSRNFKFLESLFSNGVLLVADGADEPEFEHYLTVLNNALERYPNIQADEPEMDVLDGLAMAVLDIPRVWTRVHTNVARGEVYPSLSRTPNPIRQLGSYSYFKGG
jgi:hypothetical protein